MFEFTMLASAALKGTIVLAAAAVIAWTLRRRSAAARHLVWTAAAAALLALPILSPDAAGAAGAGETGGRDGGLPGVQQTAAPAHPLCHRGRHRLPPAERRARAGA